MFLSYTKHNIYCEFILVMGLWRYYCSVVYWYIQRLFNLQLKYICCCGMCIERIHHVTCRRQSLLYGHLLFALQNTKDKSSIDLLK